MRVGYAGMSGDRTGLLKSMCGDEEGTAVYRRLKTGPGDAVKPLESA